MKTNVISLMDYKQKRLDEIIDQEYEDPEITWTVLDAMVADVLIAEDIKLMSVVDSGDTTTITFAIHNDPE
jgi:hypothetical protein